MYKIAALNKISPMGLNRFTEKYSITDDVSEAQGILVRSQDMKSMELSDNLMAIARAGAGTNNIPIDRCSEKGIVVFNTPGANANAVKELVLAGLLIAARNLSGAVAWTKTLTEDVSITVEKNKSKFAGQEIRGKTLGVIGLGAIGVMVSNAASSLGMKVIGHDPYMSVTSAHQLSSAVEVYESMDAMLPLCDFISIHVPAIENTKQMINKERFSLMKNGVCLLNFSRDVIVDDKDAAIALESGKLGYYVTDFPNKNLVENDKVICIPHLGASTSESEDNCAIMAVEQLKDYLENGNITNSVNYPTCNMGVSIAKARVVVLNCNISGMLTQITGTFADMGINISDMLNRSKGELACTIVDVDADVTESDVKKLLDIDGVTAIRVIHNTKHK